MDKPYPGLEPFLKEVETQLSSERLLIDRADLLSYSYDFSPFAFRYVPDAVYLVESRDEVIELVRIASSYKVPLTPRGASTSVTGSPLPVKGGVVVDFSRMSKIKDISSTSRETPVR
jgi:glycolate oxidase